MVIRSSFSHQDFPPGFQMLVSYPEPTANLNNALKKHYIKLPHANTSVQWLLPIPHSTSAPPESIILDYAYANKIFQFTIMEKQEMGYRFFGLI